MKIRRVAFLSMLAIIAGLFESTTLTFLPWPLAAFRPILPSVAFFISMERTPEALLFAGVAGATMDVFAMERPTFAVGRLLVIGLVLAGAAVSALTNRSIYSAIALAWIARIADWAWLLIQERLPPYSTAGTVLAMGWKHLLVCLGIDAVVSITLFLCGVLLFRRFVARADNGSIYG